MGRINIIVSQGEGAQQFEMGLEEGVQLAIAKIGLYADEERAKALIQEINARLEEYNKHNGALVLLEVEENGKLLIKITIA